MPHVYNLEYIFSHLFGLSRVDEVVILAQIVYINLNLLYALSNKEPLMRLPHVNIPYFLDAYD